MRGSFLPRKAGDTLILGYKYTYDSSNRISTVTPTSGAGTPDTTKTTTYTYDAMGQLTKCVDKSSGSTVTYNYTYDTAGNLRKAVKGSTTTTYTYAPFGAPVSTWIKDSDNAGTFNPLRYRGYFYDFETGFYYLQSRYYDPVIGRFISADTFATTDTEGFLSCNMFAYCEGDPVNRADYNGEFFDLVLDVVSLAFSVYDVIHNPKDPWAWIGLACDVIDVAVPLVSGVGEAARAVNSARKAAKRVDAATDVIQTTRKAEKATQTVKASTRSSAVRKAWKMEYDNVINGGKGLSRTWSPAETRELLSTGRVKGYQGHHMKSVKGYPHLAGDPTNIQFLTRAEHLAAHGGNWRNVTHGRYVV